MVKNHSDSERENLLLPLHGLLCLAARVLLHAGQHIPRLLLHQLWSTGWMENSLMGPP